MLKLMFFDYLFCKQLGVETCKAPTGRQIGRLQWITHLLILFSLGLTGMGNTYITCLVEKSCPQDRNQVHNCQQVCN